MHAAQGNARYMPGIPLLLIPGPTNVPARVLLAIAQPTVDHRGEAFAAFVRDLFPDPRQAVGNGLSKLRDRIFRIGHLGDFNDVMLCATLSALRSCLREIGVLSNRSGVDAALAVLDETAGSSRTAK